MKRILLVLALSATTVTFAQVNERPVTGAPFQTIVPDARAGGMGDMGVATSSDAYSQYWNASKYVFNENHSGVALSYTPWLSEISSDTFLLNLSGFTYLGEEQRSALGASIYYFNMGKVENNYIGPDGAVINSGAFSPNEFSLDLSYSLLLSDGFSMGVTGRYIRSDIYDNTSVAYQGQQAANTFAADISSFYTSPEKEFGSWSGRYRLGAVLKNIGPKLQYSQDSGDTETPLPTNFGLGGNYDFIFGENTVTLGLEYNKLLVPVAESYDSDNDGDIDGYQLPDDGVIGGMFESIGNSASTLSFGAEYDYKDALAVRLGYRLGDEDKGDSSYVTTGVGLKYSGFEFDMSYLFPTDNMDNPLSNTLRFSLAWNFGGKINDSDTNQ